VLSALAESILASTAQNFEAVARGFQTHLRRCAKQIVAVAAVQLAAGGAITAMALKAQ